MKRIDIKLTFQCNNKCRFCVQGSKRMIFEDKKIQEIRNILNESSKQYDEVVFTGGEPTVRKDILEVISYAKNKGFRIQLQTNGRLFVYRDFCKEVIEAGCRVFSISVHGHNAVLHDKLTSIKGSFEQTSKGIENLIFMGALVVTNTVINKLNYTSLPKIADFLIGLGIKQYQISFPHILGEALVNIDEVVPKKTKVMPYVIKAIELGIKNNCWPKVEAIPFCFLKNYYFCLTDNQIPETRVFDVDLTRNFNIWRKREGKIKGIKCKECKYYQSCEGPWKEYPEYFGWEEFIPVK